MNPRVSARKVPNKFRVAFSFAGEHRELVRAIAGAVENEVGSPNVFLDEWFEHYIAGADADLKLQQIYGERCSLVVVCVSEQYGGKPWTRAEHSAIRARHMKASMSQTDALGILPIRVGEGDVPGIHFNAIIPDVRTRAPFATARLIIDRLQLIEASTTNEVFPTPNLPRGGPLSQSSPLSPSALNAIHTTSVDPEAEIKLHHLALLHQQKEAAYRRPELESKTLLNRFIITKLLGFGGIASVYSAYDKTLRRLVAAKFLHSHLASKVTVDRFFRGARTMAALTHSNIVKVYDAFESQCEFDFFTMEYLPHSDLRTLVVTNQITQREAIEAVKQIGRAIDYAHKNGFIHRDVKPANILRADGELCFKLTDFDLVKDLNSTGFTQTGALGTWVFAAPEAKVVGRDADERADIYSLGMTAVFVVFGNELPADAAIDPHAFIGTLQCRERLKLVLEKCVEADPQGRFASAEEFVNELEAALGGDTCEPPLSNRRALNRLRKDTLVTLAMLQSQSFRIEGPDAISQMMPLVRDLFPAAEHISILAASQSSDHFELLSTTHIADEKSRNGLFDELRRAKEKCVMSKDLLDNSEHRASSTLWCPLIDAEGTVAGDIILQAKYPATFDETDSLVAARVADILADRLYHEELLSIRSYMQHTNQEMRSAADLQASRIGDAVPVIPGYGFSACCHARSYVGGDYYDVFMISERKVCISLGDVAGSGVAAALILSRLTSILPLIMSLTDDVSIAIQRINRHICDNMAATRFVTMILGVIDLDTNLMTLANAGHYPVIVRKPDGTLEEIGLNQIGVPVGIMDDYHYEVVVYEIQAGETFLLRTDGVDEALAPNGESYTSERVREFFGNASGSAATIANALLADVRKHANGRAPSDDIAMMVFGRDA